MKWVGAVCFSFAVCVIPSRQICQGNVCTVSVGELKKEISDSASSDTTGRSHDSDFTATIIGEECIAELEEERN